MKKMDDDELLRFLEAEHDSAYHYSSSQIAKEREQAIRDYNRMPYGTEVEGRSQVITSDVFDAVEGMLPDLLDVFISSDKAVVFDPVGPEDVEAAEEVTNACNHVFYKQNNGFLTLYTAAKDGLTLKTGGIKWWWDVKRTPKWETFRGVSEMQLAVYLSTHPKAELISKEEDNGEDEAQGEREVETEQGAQETDAEFGEQTPPKLWTVRIKTIEDRGIVKVAPIPPDELLISKNHNSILLDDCAYVAHITQKSLSDIHQLGYEDVTIDDVRAASNERKTQDGYLRDMFLDRDRFDGQTEDDSSVRGWLIEEYVLVDFDGDGITERRKITRLGKLILDNEEVSHVPIAAWTPYILTHQFAGLSVAQLVSDFQRISTEIWRAQLDNLDLANNQETVVLTDSQGNPQANIDDLLNRRPGGVLRENVAGAIRPYAQRWQGIEAMPMVEMLNSAKENRTGWTRYSQGLDANSLNKTATGVQAIMNASQKRMKLMARIMAECLVAPMFRGIFKTLQDYCMEKLTFKLSNKFVAYEPQNWRDGFDMTINVGLGTGDVIQQAGYLQQIAQAQFALMGTPMGGRVVTEANVFAVQSRIAENAGFKNPAEFWTDPKQLPPPQPPQAPPDPRVITKQMELQADAQKFQATLQADQAKFAAEMQSQLHIDQNRQEWEARQKQLELEQQAQLDQLRAQYEMQKEAARLEFDKYKADLDADVKLAIAEKNATPPMDVAPLQGAIQQLADHITAPVQIIRDASGRAIGVQKGASVMEITRGPDGRATGVQ